MKRSLDLLNQVAIASPCSVSWNEMAGDDRERFCPVCNQSVYNLSVMSATEASGFLDARGASACIRFYRRSDGTLMTRDCPEGRFQRTRKLLRRVAVALASFLSFVMINGCDRCYQGKPAFPRETDKDTPKKQK
jgi:hypothetical protein